MRKTLCAAVTVVLLWLPAPAQAGAEGSFVSKINAERRARGLGTLVVTSDLVAVARRHSARMASRGSIYHDPSLGSSIRGWRRIGDNIGRGPSVTWLHNRFMGSSSHRANILNRSFDQVGVGVVQRGDTIWVTQIFVQRGRVRAPSRVTRPASRAVPPARIASPQAPKKPRAKPARAQPSTVAVLLRLMDDEIVVPIDERVRPPRAPAGS